MKYVVMECHPAYSILMDETSRFVYAANLHYEVGQIVENPILMEETQKIQKSGISISISVRKIIAIAACLLLMIGSGVGYYQGNLAVYSTIVVSASADVSMQVNSHGKVLSLKSINLYGEQLLKNYDGKGKDKLLVTNELIQKAIAMGYLVSGDTVYFYIDTPKSAVYSSYKSELEQEMTAYADLNTAVEQYHINEETSLTDWMFDEYFNINRFKKNSAESQDEDTSEEYSTENDVKTPEFKKGKSSCFDWNTHSWYHKNTQTLTEDTSEETAELAEEATKTIYVLDVQ